MAQKKRRSRLVQLLKEADGPLTGSDLSGLLGVTRQIIVGDVAVLRARGEQIVATPRGVICSIRPMPRLSTAAPWPCATAAIRRRLRAN